MTETENRLIDILEETPDLVATATPDGYLSYINRSGRKWLGLSSDEDISTYHISRAHSPSSFQMVSKIGIPTACQEGTWSGETVMMSRDGTQTLCSQVIIAHKSPEGELEYLSTIARDITEQKKAEQTRKSHLNFLQAMEKINKSINEVLDVENLLVEVLDVIIPIFDCDRAWLLFPCDPEAPSCHVPVERTKPEFPGAAAGGIPMNDAVASLCRILLAKDGPVSWDPESENKPSFEILGQYGVKSQLVMAIYPNTGKPWILGMHQCSFARVWTDEEKHLFNEIAQRITDALNGVLAMQNLKASEERFRLVAYCASDLIYEWDIETDHLEWYGDIDTALGFKSGEFSRDLNTWFSLVHPEDQAKLAQEVAHHRESGDDLYCEYRIKRKDGSIRHWTDRGVAIMGSDGKPRRLLGACTDITESRIKEEALKASEEKHRSIFNGMDVAIWEEDISEFTAFLESLSNQGISDFERYLDDHPEAVMKALGMINITDLNDASVRMFGASSKEELISSLDKTFLLETFVTFRQALVAISKAETSFNCENIYQTLEGKRIITLINMTIPPTGSKYNRVLISMMDITERRRAEDELLRLRALLGDIIDSMPSVLVGVDKKGIITQWNTEAQKQTGVAAVDACGQYLKDAFPRLSGEMFRVKQAIKDRETKKDEKVPSKKNGQDTGYFDITIYPLLTGGAEGAVIRMDDVTDRVRMEDVIIQSEKMLSVGELAAGMAHEINNPLAGIMQNVQLLRLRTQSGLNKNQLAAEQCNVSMESVEAYFKARKIPKIIESILESGCRASQIVENMLDFSRKSESQFLPQNLADLMEKTLDLASKDYDLRKKTDFRQIEIHREYKENTPKVPCEAADIQQVLLNILKNGAEAMLTMAVDKKPRFDLRIYSEASYARIEIEDNGPGMDEAIRKRIFEPFFTTKRVGLGTGLGLSVSYFIVSEKHGGLMSVESTIGQGSKFVIRLPLKRPFRSSPISPK